MSQIWELLAGLGIFIYSMTLLEQGLRGLSTNSLRNLLRHHTRTPIQGVAVGTVSTAFLQSSSLVGLFVLAFVGSGILPLRNALGIIFGANLGTTLTGWLVTALGFKLSLGDYALVFIALGALSYVLLKQDSRGYHRAMTVLALGLLLTGLSWMKDSMSFLGEHVDPGLFRDYPLVVYFIAGAVFTALVQSSSATMVIILGALHAEIIPLHTAAAIAVGSDLGTTSTVLLGSVRGSANSRRVALGHLIFNLATDLLALALLSPLLTLITGPLGFSDPLYALVCFHSLFNMLGIALFLPITGTLASWLEGRFQSPEHTLCEHISAVPPTVPEAGLRAMGEDTRVLFAKAVLLNLRCLGLNTQGLAGTPRLAATDSLLRAQNLSFDEQYQNIKQHEVKLHDYSYSLSNSGLSEAERELLDTLLEAARNTVYSAKSLKDVRANLLDCRSQNEDGGLTGLPELNLLGIYSSLLKMIEPGSTEATKAEELASRLDKELATLHETMHQRFIDYSRREGSEPSLSTLLNINRELFVSGKTLLEAALALGQVME